MNGINYLLDTNILIYLTQEKLKISHFAKKDSNLYISSITYMETLGYAFLNKEEEFATTMFCKAFERILVTQEIEERTILIRKSHKIKLPDAIIAATAIVHDFNNVSDFKNIRGLNIFDPL